MNQLKSRQTETVTNNHRTSLDIYHKHFLQRRAKDLGLLFFKSRKLIRRLIDRNALPNNQEIEDIAERSAMFNSQNIKAFINSHALQTISALDLFSFEDCFARVTNALKIEIQSEDSLNKLNYACYSLAYFFLYKYPDITSKEMSRFEILEHRLTKHISEAIGYWLGRLETRQHGGQGGGMREMNQPILLAIKEYLRKCPKLVNETNVNIARSFARNIKGDKSIIVYFDGCEWDIYFFENKIKVISNIKEEDKHKHPDKLIAYSTFRNRYIREAKKIIKETQTHNQI